jgi:exonuclease III
MRITALQEVRWTESGWIRKKNCSFTYSGHKTLKGRSGTGFMITGSAVQSIFRFDPISDRMCKLRIKGKFNNMTLLSVYVPTEGSNGEEIEQFHSDLSNICDKVPKHDALILLGDFNARIGKELANQRVAGKYTLRDQTSNNGERLIQLAQTQNLEISSTKFPHNEIHKSTW